MVRQLLFCYPVFSYRAFGVAYQHEREFCPAFVLPSHMVVFVYRALRVYGAQQLSIFCVFLFHIRYMRRNAICLFERGFCGLVLLFGKDFDLLSVEFLARYVLSLLQLLLQRQYEWIGSFILPYPLVQLYLFLYVHVA